MNITPSTRPTEAIANTDLLMRAAVRDEQWRAAVESELNQLAKFAAEGNGRLADTSDPATRRHIATLLQDLERARNRLKEATQPPDDWGRTIPASRSIIVPDTPPLKDPIHSLVAILAIGGGAVVVLVLALFLWARSQPRPNPSASQPVAPPQSAQAAPVSKGVNFATALPGGAGSAVNWAAENTIYRLRVHHIEFATQFGNSSLTKADPGNIYVSLDVEVTAISQPISSIYLGDFHLKDADNFEYEPKRLWVREPDFKDQDNGIAQGKSSRGWVTFEIPQAQMGKLDLVSLQPWRLTDQDRLKLKIPRNAN